MSSLSAVRPIESTSMAERVTTELRRSILSGDLEPGQKFSLREVAGMLDVSFIPVREALRQLETEGLVVTRPGRSAFVAPLDLGDLQAIYRLRRHIEPDIASRSCLLLSDDELDRLEGQAAKFGDQHLSMDAIYESHLNFHRALFAPAASQWDVRILTTLWRAGERYVRIGFGRLDPDPMEHVRREDAHESLVAAFRKREPLAAATAIREHLDRNETLALGALNEVADAITEPV